MRSILVPIDGSEGSMKAVCFAADLAQATGARIVLLTVYDSAVIALMQSAAVSGDVEAAVARVSRSILERGRTMIGERPIEMRTVATVGRPSQEIIACAEAEACDLIVIGSRGMSSFKGLLLGSVSDQVVHAARCAVTVVH